MSKYILPAEKPPKKSVNALNDDMSYERKVTIPVNDAILSDIDNDDNVQVILTGRVERTTNIKGPGRRQQSISLNLSTVECKETTKDKDEKQFQSGYKKGRDKS